MYHNVYGLCDVHIFDYILCQILKEWRTLLRAILRFVFFSDFTAS